MRKSLSVMGNSLCLIIDKPLRELLGLGYGTVVQLTIDGRRLVIEPVRDATAIRPVRRRSAGSPVDRAEVPSRRVRGAETGDGADPNGAVAPSCHEPGREARLLRDEALRDFHALDREFGIGNLELAQLFPGVPRTMRYLIWLESADALRPSAAERATIARFAECLGRLRAGQSWDDAIAASLTAFPRTPCAG